MAINVYSFAYSGVLDTFQGWDITEIGLFAQDDFDLTDSDMIVKIRIDDSQRWDGNGYSKLYVKACKKNLWGNYIVVSTKYINKAPYDTSYSYLNYSGLSTGNYKLFFQSYWADKVDFTGTVYDDE